MSTRTLFTLVIVAACVGCFTYSATVLDYHTAEVAPRLVSPSAYAMNDVDREKELERRWDASRENHSQAVKQWQAREKVRVDRLETVPIGLIEARTMLWVSAAVVLFVIVINLFHYLTPGAK